MNIKRDKTIDDFIYMEQLELKYYSEEHVTPYQEAYLWHLSNPNTGFVLEDNGKIAAFTDILPVKHGIFYKILDGSFNDKYLTSDDLIDMEELKDGDSVSLLLSCVLVDDDYRHTDALKILLNAHLDYYRDYVSRGITVESVITSNVTEAGERFSERMGFERIGRSKHQTTLYQTSFRQFDELVRQMKPKLEVFLLKYEKDLLDPDYCKDINNLNDRIAKDFMEYGQSGTIYHRDEMIHLLQSKKDTRVSIENFTIKYFSKYVAVAHYTAIRKGETTQSSLRTSIWIKEDDRWKLFFHQGTEIQRGNEVV